MKHIPLISYNKTMRYLKGEHQSDNIQSFDTFQSSPANIILHPLKIYIKCNVVRLDKERRMGEVEDGCYAKKKMPLRAEHTEHSGKTKVSSRLTIDRDSWKTSWSCDYWQ